jgi:hypothetical protein
LFAKAGKRMQGDEKIQLAGGLYSIYVQEDMQSGAKLRKYLKNSHF